MTVITTTTKSTSVRTARKDEVAMRHSQLCLRVALGTYLFSKITRSSAAKFSETERLARWV